MGLDWGSINWTIVAAIGGPATAVVAVYLAYWFQVAATTREKRVTYFADALVDLDVLSDAARHRVGLWEQYVALCASGVQTTPEKLTEFQIALDTTSAVAGLRSINWEGFDPRSVGAYQIVRSRMSETVDLLDNAIFGLSSKVYRNAEAAFLFDAPEELTDEIEAIRRGFADVAHSSVDDDDRKRGLDTISNCNRAIGRLKDKLREASL